MENFNLRIRRVEVLTGDGPDKVIIVTDLPQGVHPFEDSGQVLEFKVAAGKGALYVQKNFNINPKVTKV